MNDYLVYLDLPTIPEELLESIEEIINKPPKEHTNVPAHFTYFETRPVNPRLTEWMNDIFKTSIGAQYQIVKPNITIHKDIGRNVAFNYLLKTGGDAHTCFFDDDKHLLHMEKIPVNRWHRIRTDVYHNVIGVTSDRVSVSMMLSDYKWNDPLFFI